MKPDEHILSPLNIAKVPVSFLAKMQPIAIDAAQKCAIDHEIARRRGGKHSAPSTPMAVDVVGKLIPKKRGAHSDPFIAGYVAEAMSRRSERGDEDGD